MNDPFEKEIGIQQLDILLKDTSFKPILENLLLAKFEAESEEGKLNSLPLIHLPYPRISSIINKIGEERFFQILKCKIGDGKPLYDSSRDFFIQGQFSERDAIWNTNDSRQLKISEMPSKHLYNSLKLICSKHKNSPVIRHYIKCMFYQIQLREDLTEEQMTNILNLAVWVKNNL
jgi:hypothetical protein